MHSAGRVTPYIHTTTATTLDRALLCCGSNVIAVGERAGWVVGPLVPQFAHLTFTFTTIGGEW